MAINKKSFLSAIKKGVSSFSPVSVTRLPGRVIEKVSAVKTKAKQRKIIENVARQKVKKARVGGESAEQLQQQFVSKTKQLKKNLKRRKKLKKK